MAHLQIRGKRMSGKKVPLVLGKTIDLEVWGPINALASPSHEYQVISSDPDRVELAAGSLNTRANLRLYKATAKTFGTATVMIQEGDLEIDFVDVQVLPNPSNVPFASWYAEVLPGIMRALRARGRFAGPSIENKAGFFIAQAFSEQSPGAVGDPSANGNRLFNVQALVTRDSANRITGVVPGQTDDGVSIQNLRQGEGKTEETRVKLASPTFVYDSTERAVAHYINKILPGRYMGAFRVITTSSATFAQFAQALQDAKFATHANYAADLQRNSFQAIKGAQTWISFQTHNLADELAKTTNDAAVKALNAELELLHDAQEQLRRFR